MAKTILEKFETAFGVKAVTYSSEVGLSIGFADEKIDAAWRQVENLVRSHKNKIDDLAISIEGMQEAIEDGYVSRSKLDALIRKYKAAVAKSEREVEALINKASKEYFK